MVVAKHWTVSDLEHLPKDGSRYEIIGGELYVSTQPHFYHQRACVKLVSRLEDWSDKAGLGLVNSAPGIIFSDEDAVAPDLIWISNARLALALNENGKLYDAPDLVVEVLSPGRQNEERDRKTKLDLYSRRGVLEYWLVDWRARSIQVYRSEGGRLVLSTTLQEGDELASPLLPGFRYHVEDLFRGIPPVPSK
jgi:Uma2 family endonuclease